MKKIMKMTCTVALLSGLVGCASKVPAPQNSAGAPYVNHIELSETRGEVGKRFSSEIEISALRLGTSEVSVSNLPEGLAFEPSTGNIVGTPTKEGFYTISVAVRKEKKKGIQYNTVRGNWFTEEIELSIYKPIPEEVLAGILPEEK